MRSEICKRLIIAILINLLIVGIACPAEQTRTLIIYPNVKAPLQRIYTRIIEGINQVSLQSKILTINIDTQPSQLEATLQQIKPEKIITLGRTTAEKVAQTDYRDQMIVAAALFDPFEYSGISLAIDSRILLKKIKTLLPFVNNVFVIDYPSQPSIRIYSENLQGQPLITPLYHKDPLVNTQVLWKLLDKNASKSDAIILPSHLDRDILYELVQLAWEKKIILLSTNLAHLKEGVLMAFYPDNTGMGRQIGSFVIEHKAPGYESLSYIHVALNPTIAKHLGLKFAPDVLSQFQLLVK